MDLDLLEMCQLQQNITSILTADLRRTIGLMPREIA